MGSLRSLGRCALVLAASLVITAWHGHRHPAYAKGDDGGDDAGGDDGDDNGDDNGDKANKDGGDDTTDEPDEDDKDQPAVTAGGLFTLKTYPQAEMQRPLTMTQHITQLRLDLGTDISAKGAFGTFGVGLEGMYGVTDNFSVLGGFTNAYNFKQFDVYAGFEGALVYDLLDIRLTADVHRNAIALYCDTDPGAPANCQDPTMPGVLPNLPDGNYDSGGTKVSVNLGFPFRYAVTPQVAVVALQTLITFDFNGVDVDHVASTTDSSGNTKTVPVGNGSKPDFNPSVGVAANPIPQLSVVVFAQLRIPDFDTSAANFQVPVTGRVEISPNQKLDVGLEFTLLNIAPPAPQTAIDNRFLSLFMQARI